MTALLAVLIYRESSLLGPNYDTCSANTTHPQSGQVGECQLLQAKALNFLSNMFRAIGMFSRQGRRSGQTRITSRAEPVRSAVVVIRAGSRTTGAGWAGSVVAWNRRRGTLGGSLTGFLQDCQQGRPAGAMHELQTNGDVVCGDDACEESEFVLENC